MTPKGSTRVNRLHLLTTPIIAMMPALTTAGSAGHASRTAACSEFGSEADSESRRVDSREFFDEFNDAGRFDSPRVHSTRPAETDVSAGLAHGGPRSPDGSLKAGRVECPERAKRVEGLERRSATVSGRPALRIAIPGGPACSTSTSSAAPTAVSTRVSARTSPNESPRTIAPRARRGPRSAGPLRSRTRSRSLLEAKPSHASGSSSAGLTRKRHRSLRAISRAFVPSPSTDHSPSGCPEFAQSPPTSGAYCCT